MHQYLKRSDSASSAAGVCLRIVNARYMFVCALSLCGVCRMAWCFRLRARVRFRVRAKWEYLPKSPYISEGNRAAKAATCRFCVHQYLKHSDSASSAAGVCLRVVYARYVFVCALSLSVVCVCRMAWCFRLRARVRFRVRAKWEHLPKTPYVSEGNRAAMAAQCRFCMH